MRASLVRAMNACPSSAPRRQSGVSLMEVLIGIAVGMIGILVIFQTIVVWDKHTQTTRSGSEAGIAGTLAMFNLERDIKLAGFGFARANAPTMGCGVDMNRNGTPVTGLVFAPVRISSSPTGDVIDVLHGNSAYYVTAEDFTDSTTSTKKLKRRGGFKAGDKIVVSGNSTASAASADCVMYEVTDVGDADGVTLKHESGTYTSFYGPSASAAFNGVTGAPAFTTGHLFNLGPMPEWNTWSISAGGVLQRTEQIGANPLVPAAKTFSYAENVADMKAEYGVDVNNDQRIADTEWTTALPADWTKLLAVRVGILVRSQRYEKDADTPDAAASSASAPIWSGTPQFEMKNVDGTADSGIGVGGPNNWRNYRYKVHERIIPLRNMIWGAPL